MLEVFGVALPDNIIRRFSVRSILRSGLALIFCAVFAFSSAVPMSLSAANAQGPVLMIGDSMFAWGRIRGGGVGRNLQKEIGTKVRDQSRTGAHLTIADGHDGDPLADIRKQYVTGDWNWVVINGGANDLLFECGCGKCGRVMKELVTADLQAGALIDIINAARGDGAKIMLVGYHTGYAKGHFFSGCRQDVTELVARYRALAKRNDDIFFVSARDALDAQNRSHFALDRVHPSRKGAKRIAQLIALGIEQAEASLR